MKTKLILTIALLFITLLVHGQGVLVYDQQSASDNTLQTESGLIVPLNQPLGQSFIPQLSSVGFVSLALNDFNPGNSLGGTMYINLLANSITGTVVSATSPVFMPDNFNGMTNFFFSTQVSVNPGTTYYFQPVIQSGDTWVAQLTQVLDSYPDGTAFMNGQSITRDLWFREGIVVTPEPSTVALVLIGSGLLVWHRRKNRRIKAKYVG